MTKWKYYQFIETGIDICSRPSGLSTRDLVYNWDGLCVGMLSPRHQPGFQNWEDTVACFAMPLQFYSIYDLRIV